MKLGRFKAAHKGQMELYLKWLDRHERQADEEAPIGLILCAESSREQVELLQMQRMASPSPNTGPSFRPKPNWNANCASPSPKHKNAWPGVAPCRGPEPKFLLLKDICRIRADGVLVAGDGRYVAVGADQDDIAAAQTVGAAQVAFGVA